MKRNYILVTPMKNEENNIGKTIDSVVAQVLKPKLWIIVDDASDDNSAKIVIDKSKKNKWIKLLSLTKRQKYDLGIHYSEVCIDGFKQAIRMAKIRHIEYDYVGLMDADTILESDYFLMLILKFEQNKNLGLASGNLVNIIGDKKQTPKVKSNQVCGTGRMWTKACFINTGGYTKTCAPDTVSEIKAKLRNYEVNRFKDISVYQNRLTASNAGLWNGYKSIGYRQYYIHINPIHAILKAIKLTLIKPFYLGIAYFIGYFGSWLCIKPKLEDQQIKYYNWHRFT